MDAGQGVERLIEGVPPGHEPQAAPHDEQLPLLGGVPAGGLEPAAHRDAGHHHPLRVRSLGDEAPADGLLRHQIAVGAGVEPLAVAGHVGDAGDQGDVRGALFLVAGHGGGGDGVGGYDHIGLVLVQQPVQAAQQVVSPAVAGVVHRQVVVDVVKDPAVGHQHVEPPVHGGGQLGVGIFKQIDNVGPVAVLGQLLPQRVGGGQMAHAEFSCQNQDVHSNSLQISTMLSAV